MTTIIRDYFVYHVVGHNFDFSGKGREIRKLVTKDLIANADVYNVVIETIDGITLHIPESSIQKFSLTYGLEDD